MSKTPAYTRKASKKYHAKISKKQVVFNTEKDIEKKLLAAINNDNSSFSATCKKLLIKHYDIS